MEFDDNRIYHGHFMSEDCQSGLVSVIIPTHNRARQLVEAMNSAFAQTYRSVELVVVDDGSTDDTKDIVQRWQNELSHKKEMKVRYIYQNNKGANSARNLGFRRSRGEFILFHDSDDILDRKRVSLQVERLVSEAADMCSGSFLSFPSRRTRYICPQSSDDAMLDFLKWRIQGGTQCWMIRRDLINAVEGYDEDLICYQDLDLTFRLLAMSPKVVFEPEALTYFRVHDGDRVSSQKYTEEGIKSILQSHKRRVNILKNSFNSQEYLDAENRQLLSVAIRAWRSGLYGIVPGFMNLSKQLNSRSIPGCTWIKKGVFRISGVRGCGLAMRLLERSK